MWDPKRLYEDRTPPPLEEAPRPIETRPVLHTTEKQRRATLTLQRPRKRKVLLKWLGFDTYKAYIQSALWKGIRQRILVRAAGVCEFCHVVPPCIVHHLNYEWETLNGRDDLALVAVCEPCHDNWHRARRKGKGNKRRHHGKRKRRLFKWKHLGH